MHFFHPFITSLPLEKNNNSFIVYRDFSNINLLSLTYLEKG